MKYRYLASTLLSVAIASASFAKTGSEADREKPITPFTKKRDSQLQLTPSPKPSPAPITPAMRTSISGRNYLGLELGITSSVQTDAKNYAVAGNYEDGIRNAELNEFSPGLSFMAHGVLDLAFNPDLGFQAKLGYRQHKANAKGTSPAGNVSGTDPEFKNDVNFTWDYFGLDALLRVQLATDGLYALGGLGYSSLLSSFISGTQTFDDPFAGTGELKFEGEPADFYNSTRFDAKLGLGTWIPVGDNGMVLAPELMIGIPLTALHTTKLADAYTAIDREVNNMLYASLGLSIKFPFGGNSSSSDGYVYDNSSSSSSSSSSTTVESGKAMLSGRVVDNAGRPIDDAQVTVVDLNNNQVVATDKTDDGMYNVKVDAPGRYSVTADAPGYLFGSALYEVDKDGRILKSSGDIKLSPSADGRVRLLVFFDFDKATLQSASYPELNRAVALMKSNPNMRVEIAGFTDAQGTDSYNKDLSQRRATAVREYLVRQGIDASRLTAVGYGEANPVATNDTEDGRAENRRVEFVVVKR